MHRLTGMFVKIRERFHVLCPTLNSARRQTASHGVDFTLCKHYLHLKHNSKTSEMEPLQGRETREPDKAKANCRYSDVSINSINIQDRLTGNCDITSNSHRLQYFQLKGKMCIGAPFISQ